MDDSRRRHTSASKQRWVDSDRDAGVSATPLDGLTVIELAGLGPVPFAGMILAGLGADVIRIDRPGGSPILDPMVGNFVSPVARILLMPTIPTTTNGTPTYRIFM